LCQDHHAHHALERYFLHSTAASSTSCPIYIFLPYSRCTYPDKETCRYLSCWPGQCLSSISFLNLLLSACLFIMAPERPYISLFPNSVLDMELWQRFMADPQITADCPPPDNSLTSMSTSKSAKPVILTAAEQQETVGCVEALWTIWP
jgi:hypothetical protein